MASPVHEVVHRLDDNQAVLSRIVLSVVLPILFDAVILTADVLEGPKTAYVGVLVASPLLAAVFGSVRMVATVSVVTWLAAFTFGKVASDGNVPAQNVRLLFIAGIALVAIGSAELRLRRERRYSEALVRNAEVESMQRLANIDTLTGLLNRRGFFAVADAGRPADAALAVIDIDRFKQLNDRHGHPAGDTFIVAVAQRLKSQFRDDDVVARWGGDEFLLRISAPLAQAERTLQRAITAVCADPIVIDGQRLDVSVSAGLAEWPASVTFDDAFRQADARMYEAKRGSGDRSRFEG